MILSYSIPGLTCVEIDCRASVLPLTRINRLHRPTCIFPTKSTSYILLGLNLSRLSGFDLFRGGRHVVSVEVLHQSHSHNQLSSLLALSSLLSAGIDNTTMLPRPFINVFLSSFCIICTKHPDYGVERGISSSQKTEEWALDVRRAIAKGYERMPHGLLENGGKGLQHSRSARIMVSGAWRNILDINHSFL